MDDALIRLEAIRFRYDPERLVLNGASLALLPGEKIAVTGANGAGKTTLLHVAVGLLKPEAGTVRAFGEARAAEADFFDVRRRAGLLFQDPDDQLFCPTVLEDAAFGPLNLGCGRAEAEACAREALERVGLSGYEDRVAHHLSLGEKRLASLAAVLAMRPDVLLLDEPVNGLDERMEERVTQLLEDLPQAMLFVAHEKSVRARVATRAVRMENGGVADG